MNKNVEWAQLDAEISSLNEIEKFGLKNLARAGFIQIILKPSGTELTTLYRVDFDSGLNWKLLNLDNGGIKDFEIVEILRREKLLPFTIEALELYE